MEAPDRARQRRLIRHASMMNNGSEAWRWSVRARTTAQGDNARRMRAGGGRKGAGVYCGERRVAGRLQPRARQMGV